MKLSANAWVFYGVALLIYSIYTLWLLAQSQVQYIPVLWLQWSLVGFMILVWLWAIFQPKENLIQRWSSKWGESYAHFCQGLWGQGLLLAWLVGLLWAWWFEPSDQPYLSLFVLGCFSSSARWWSVPRWIRLWGIQLSLPLALYVWSWQIITWLVP